MEFEPQNQKQTEALEFASQLATLLNEGLTNGHIDPVSTQNYATNQKLINYSISNLNSGIYPDTNQISKL